MDAVKHRRELRQRRAMWRKLGPLVAGAMSSMERQARLLAIEQKLVELGGARAQHLLLEYEGLLEYELLDLLREASISRAVRSG